MRRLATSLVAVAALYDKLLRFGCSNTDVLISAAVVEQPLRTTPNQPFDEDDVWYLAYFLPGFDGMKDGLVGAS